MSTEEVITPAARVTPRPLGRGWVGALFLLLWLSSSASAQDLSKASLAWNLPWDADWVTAVTFAGSNKVAAGNNLGHILVWELPGESGGAAPKPVRRLV